MTGPLALSERAREVVRVCSVCDRDIVPLSWYPDTPVETDKRLTWVHVETGKRTHTGICISVLYATPKRPEGSNPMTIEQGWDEANEHHDQENEQQEEYDRLQLEHEQDVSDRRREAADFVGTTAMRGITTARGLIDALEEIDCAAGCDNCMGSAGAALVRSFLDDAARNLAAARALLTEGLTK